ncbi:MAG: ABC transporter substrate-binding protein [Phycisphaerae bacterium]
MRHALLAVWIVSLTVGGCSDRQGAPKDTPAPPAMLTVGHVGHDHQLALYVAALEGERFRKDWGIYLKEIKPREVYDIIEDGKALARLRLLKVGGGSRMPAAMSRGEIEIGLGGTVPVAKFADGGQPFKIICPLQTDGDMLVMRKDSPVADWASFVAATKSGGKPLKIGYKAPVAVAKLVFERALKAEGIDYSYDAAETKTKVVLVNFGSEKSPIPLLESGAIDGFVMNQPAVAVAVSKGLGKAVAELRDLPPKGKWIDHPCCCVAATSETLEKHPGPVKAFLKVILLSTQLINADRPLAIKCASRWTKYDEEVEKDSIPTIGYVAEPTDSWLAGMKTWAEMLREVKLFTGKYATATPEEFVADVCDLGLCRAAAAELRRKGLLK